jgi:uncharacterized OsmC-like protein
VSEEIVNGLKLSKMQDIIESVKDKPDIGKVKHRARNEWVNGAHCRTAFKDFYGFGKEREHTQTFVLDADLPAGLQGEDYGPGAAEALLHALASCLNETYVFQATAQGVQIDELKLILEADLDLRGFLGIDESVRRGYQNICVTFKIKGDAPKEKLEELCDLTQKYSPVFDMITNSIPVSVNTETK